MIFDAEGFLNEYRISTFPAGSKNVPAGCIGVRCPFCGDRTSHMHFRLNGFYVRCWRCGRHKLSDVVSALLGAPAVEANRLITPFIKDAPGIAQTPPVRIFAPVITLPGGTGPLAEIHRDYLISRNYDPYELERLWRLAGTNHIDPNYRHRIIAPIYCDNVMVSYQARDVTGRQEPTYRACPPRYEVVSHKAVLYGIDLARGSSIVVVEGVTDAWRLGAGAVATFGVKWTTAQAMQIVNHPTWNRVFILYDADKPGQIGGLALFHFLRGFLDNVELLELTEWADPGSIPDTEARYLMRKELKI